MVYSCGSWTGPLVSLCLNSLFERLQFCCPCDGMSGELILFKCDSSECKTVKEDNLSKCLSACFCGSHRKVLFCWSAVSRTIPVVSFTSKINTPPECESEREPRLLIHVW